MIDTASTTTTPSSQHVLFIRQWPDPQWLTPWLEQPITLILSEQALLAVCEEPERLAQLPFPAYALQQEVALLGLQTLPAGVIQLGAARWVELTLTATTYQVWDHTCLS